MKGKIPPGPPLPKGGEDLEPGTWNLEPALVWLDYCLGETMLALAAVKEAALEAMRQGEAMSPAQFAAMCEAATGIITLRGRAARGFRASCPPSTFPQQADET